MISDGEVNCVFLPDRLKDRYPTTFTCLLQILQGHGIEVHLLTKVKDIWARDYCPVQVEPAWLMKFRYDPDYLKDHPEARTGDGFLTSFRGLARCRRSDIILDGGNIVASKTKVIVTDKIYKENPVWARPELRAKIKKQLKIEHLIGIPKEPFDPIGHSDAMVRFIDESSVLVNDYSDHDARFFERFLNTLRRHHLTIEPLPYCPERRSRAGIPSAVGCYTNYLRTEKVLVAPVYGIKQDHVAMKRLKTVFPGLPIVPLDCTDLARDGGVLNCVSASYRFSPKSR